MSDEALRPIRIAWVGYHVEGLPTLEELIRQDRIAGAVTLEPAALVRRSGAADIAGICRASGIPCLK